MSKQKTIASTLLALIVWTVLGGFLGAAGGYMVYVRQPAIFQSEGLIQLTVAGTQATAEYASDTQDATDAVAEPAVASSGADMIASQSVLTRAASMGRLGSLSGISGRAPEDVAKSIQQSGNLVVVATDDDAVGTVYEVRYRGVTPSVTEQVVQAVMRAAVQSMTEVDNRSNWNEAVELLTQSRQQIEERIETLEDQLDQLDAPGDSVMVDGKFVSLVAQQYNRLRDEERQLQELRRALTQKLRRVESLIQNGASTEAILANLDVPIMPAVSKQQAAAGRSAGNDDAERRRQVADRLAIERQMMPIKRELDKLLKEFGAKHPTVAFKQKQYDRLKAKLDQLDPMPLGSPDDPPESESTLTESTETDVAKLEGSEAAQKVMASLRALRSEKQRVQQELDQLIDQLDPVTTEFTKQENLERERSRLNRELDIQYELLAQTQDRLEGLSSRPPFPALKATVLREPIAGVQVEPQLKPLLIRGSQIGLMIGLVLVSLLYLTSLATGE